MIEICDFLELVLQITKLKTVSACDRERQSLHGAYYLTRGGEVVQDYWVAALGALRTAVASPLGTNPFEEIRIEFRRIHRRMNFDDHPTAFQPEETKREFAAFCGLTESTHPGFTWFTGKLH
jgi:hypothetical protein